MSRHPDFHSESFLREQIEKTMAFYHPNAVDANGGFFQYFRDNGTIYDRNHRHLVSSARFVFNYAMASREYENDEYLGFARHGLRYLREVHRDSRTGGYAWTIVDGRRADRTNHCYGQAFVLLAYAVSVSAGLDEAAEWLHETWRLLEERFWEPGYGLYRDEADADWVFTTYRGQNANMHMCEAMIAAYEATGSRRFLDRALTLADHMTKARTESTGGLIWEHYDSQWRVNWDYNRDNPRHLFRPWGFQAGHQIEWAKLLLMLDRHVEENWLIPTAQFLFDKATSLAWDEKHGGICYGFGPNGQVCDGDKYFWVQAETIATAAILAERTGEKEWWSWYERVWDYVWNFFIDHDYGAWYRILDNSNRKYDDKKSPAGKTDYHTMGACYEVLRVLRSASKSRGFPARTGSKDGALRRTQSKAPQC